MKRGLVVIVFALSACAQMPWEEESLPGAKLPEQTETPAVEDKTDPDETQNPE